MRWPAIAALNNRKAACACNSGVGDGLQHSLWQPPLAPAAGAGALGVWEGRLAPGALLTGATQRRHAGRHVQSRRGMDSGMAGRKALRRRAHATLLRAAAAGSSSRRSSYAAQGWRSGQALGLVDPASGGLLRAGQAQPGVVWVEAMRKAQPHRHHAALRGAGRGAAGQMSGGGRRQAAARRACWERGSKALVAATLSLAAATLPPPLLRRSACTHACTTQLSIALTSLGLSAALKLTMLCSDSMRRSPCSRQWDAGGLASEAGTAGRRAAGRLGTSPLGPR